jgi:hypothetical protein
MGAQALRRRLDKIEQMQKGRSVFSPECSCFPEQEQPVVGFPIELEIAFRVKCPVHGKRFMYPRFFVYVSQWLREKLWSHLRRHSEQYRKAWNASFPAELWPAQEELLDGQTFLRLKDGTRILADDRRGIRSK